MALFDIVVVLYIIELLYYTVIDDVWGIGGANFKYYFILHKSTIMPSKKCGLSKLEQF